MQRLVVFLNELPPDVEQVDLTPGDHDPGEGFLIRASTLVGPGERETQGRRGNRVRSGKNLWVSICFSSFSLPNQGAIFCLCLPQIVLTQIPLCLGLDGQAKQSVRVEWCAPKIHVLLEPYNVT